MEILTEPTFRHVTWIVRDFLKLPQQMSYFLDSPEFLFSGDRYCLRLYPKGESGGTEFYVRRLSVTFPERKVSSQIGIRRRQPSGDEIYLYFPSSLDTNQSYSRSEIKEYRDEYIPYGSLTLVCKLWLSEEGEAGSSARGEEERGGFPGHCAAFSSRWSSTKMELETEFPCTQVQLVVPKVLELLGETEDSLTSPEFRFAGDTYCLRLEAGGDTADTHLELVRLTSNLTENTVYYRVGSGSRGWPTYPSNSRPLVGSRGFCLSRSKLEEEREKYIWNDNLQLVLFLQLGERSGFTGIHQLQCDFRQVLEEGTVSDACIIVDGKEFRVHRVVLCSRSTVFKAMFTHDTAEKESGRVVVDDLDPDSFELFLEYLYAGNVQAGLSDDNVFGLYAAADKYDVSFLRSECLEHMRRSLSVDSFCNVVSLALRHSEEHLLQHSIHFLRDNLQHIIVTAKWKQFIIDDGAAANELLIQALVPGTL